MDITSKSRLFRDSVRAHVETQSFKNKHISMDNRHEYVGFCFLDQKDKYKLTALALVSNEFDSFDLFFQLDDSDCIVNNVIYQCVAEKTVKKKDAINKVLDAIIAEKADNFQEVFEEEWEKFYFKSQERWNFNRVDAQIQAHLEARS